MTTTQTFAPTGGTVTWTVPQGVTSIYVVVEGGAGGNGGEGGRCNNVPVTSGANWYPGGSGGYGGRGGRSEGRLTVVPGQTYTIRTAYRGGGGYFGGSADYPSSGGTGGPGGAGGASYVTGPGGSLGAAGGGGGGGGTGATSSGPGSDGTNGGAGSGVTPGTGGYTGAGAHLGPGDSPTYGNSGVQGLQVGSAAATSDGTVAITYDTNSPPNVPTITSPANGSTATTALPSLVGTFAANTNQTSQKSRIEYQLATDTGFTANLKTVDEPNAAYRTSGSYALALTAADPLKQGTWYIRARTLPNDGISDPSGWSAASSFVVSHPPSATDLKPTGGTGIAYAATTRLSWKFSDMSPGDSQSAYQIRVERNDTGALVLDTGKVVSTSQFADVAIDPSLKGVALRWRIKLWDSEDVEGQWTAYSVFTVADAPSITITSPAAGGTINSNAPTVAWSVSNFGTRYQASYEVTVTKVGTATALFDSGVITGSADSYVANASQIRSGNDYQITVTITDNTGIVGSATITVTAQYDEPPNVSPDVDTSMYDTLGYVRLTWLSDADPDFLRWRIYRRVTGSTDWTVLAEILQGTVTEYHDWLAVSMETYEYYVTQVVNRFGEEIESSVVAPVAVAIPSGGYWLIDPVDASNNTRLDNVSEDSYSDVVESAELVVVGRGRHVDVGETVGISGSLTAQLRDSSTGTARFKKKRIESLKLLKKPAYLRNPFGDLNLVNMGDVQVSRIAGVGAQEAVDVTIPYLEIS